MTKLEEGTKYLSIVLSTEKALYLAHKAINEGKENINLAAFLNEERKGQQPHYKSESISIWISKKKETTKPVEELI